MKIIPRIKFKNSLIESNSENKKRLFFDMNNNLLYVLIKKKIQNISSKIRNVTSLQMLETVKGKLRNTMNNIMSINRILR